MLELLQMWVQLSCVPQEIRCRGGVGEAADHNFGVEAIGFIHVESRIVSVVAHCHQSINPVIVGGTNVVTSFDLIVRQGRLFEQDFCNCVSKSVKVMNKNVLARAMKSNVGGDSKGDKGFREMRFDVKGFSIGLGANAIMIHAMGILVHGLQVCHG